jgi:hypothetical protein
MDTIIPEYRNPLMRGSFLDSDWLDPSLWFNQGASFLHFLFDLIVRNGHDIITLFHTMLFFIALFFLTIISYCIVRIFEIRQKEHRHLQHEIAEYAHHKAEREKKKQETGVSKNERWVQTLDYLFSQHASDWKLAVIEADSMLETLMDQLGFKGENLGDKLKSATQETFRDLSLAWEVHTIRNKIAHEGTAFEFSQHEAKRVIAIYEQIFRNFGFI